MGLALGICLAGPASTAIAGSIETAEGAEFAANALTAIKQKSIVNNIFRLTIIKYLLKIKIPLL